MLKEAYPVDGFPHYVLVDKEGKIVENKTHRPSDPRLSALIEVALNKQQWLMHMPHATSTPEIRSTQ